MHGKPPRAGWLRWLIGAWVAGALGCTSFEHVHFVSSVDPGEESESFYRVTVGGWSAFSLTSFKYGWYDADSVRELFGALPKPTEPDPDPQDPKKTGSNGVEAPEIQTVHPRYEAAPPGEGSEEEPPRLFRVFDGNGREVDVAENELVVFLHTDADYLAKQLTDLAKDKEITRDVVSLLTADERQELADAQVEEEGVGALLAALDRDGSAVLGALHALRRDSGKPEAHRDPIARVWTMLAHRAVALATQSGTGPLSADLKPDSGQKDIDGWWTRFAASLGGKP